MHGYNFHTMDLMHDGLCQKVLYASEAELDHFTSMEAELTTVVARSQSMEFNSELRRVWVPQSRWNMMVRQYVNPEALDDWLNLIEYRFADQKKRGSAVLRTNLVASRTGGKGTVRNLGSCMLSLSFCLKPKPTITLHSRTSYMGYLSLLDMSVAHVAARMVADRIGDAHENFEFVWFLESMQFHGFRTMAFPAGDDDQRQRFLETSYAGYPALCNARKHYDKFMQQDEDGVLYSGMPFTSYRRVRKRLHTEVFGVQYAEQFSDPNSGKSDHRAYKPLPAVNVNSLTFAPIGR